MRVNLFIKRVIDIIGSSFGIIIAIPIMIFIAILVKIDSKGPIIFKQERLGKHGEVFKIFKFRTMIVNAEKIGYGIRIKNENDCRITKVGRRLRKTKLDELPQLLNVLTGEMSLVGPRPPVTYHPYQYNNYDEFKRQRFLMRPGITGLAQISLEDGATWDDRIKVDVEYVNKFSVLLDIKVLLMTMGLLFNPKRIHRKDKTAICARNVED